jgi:hypothetical protein
MPSWWEKPGSGNRSQENTPKDITFLPQETVTVVDPRHPLFGRTLPLLGITNKQNLIPCCVVWIDEGVERIVPVAATDRAAEAPVIFPAPLSPASVRQLLVTFARMTARSGEKTADEASRQATAGDSTDRAGYGGEATRREGDAGGADLGAAHTDATTGRHSGAGAGGAPPDGRGGER